MTPRFPSNRTILRGSIAALALAPILGAAPALAQATPQSVSLSPSAPLPLSATSVAGNASGASAPSAENVTVTGSRLRTSNLTSESPVVVLTSKQIEASSASTIQDVLRLLPQSGTSGTYASTNNGGNGSQCQDLRNLGIARTLILVNGKRFVHTPYGDGFDCVDLTTIPVALVDRIEVLTGGATTIYGADAVAGVINIITKKNFVGSQVNANGNISASGDAREGLISDTTGFDFMNGRGNVALTGSYLDSGPVAQKDRDWANPVISADNGPDAPVTIGSGYTPNGRIFGLESGTSYGTDINNSLTRFRNTYLGGADGSNAQNGRYNYGYDQDLVGRYTQGNLDGSAHFDINDHITAYVDAYYTHKNTQQRLSGQPISGTVDGSQLYVIPQGNPYAEALGIDEDVYQYKRTIDWGPRTYDTAADVYQFDGGFKGNITGNWDYDVSYAYGRAVNTINQSNQVNFNRLEQEAGFQQTDPSDPNTGVYNPGICTGNCVLGNPFGAGNLSQAGINYASFTSHSQSYYQLRDLNLSITNNKLLQLPYGPLGLAVGMEHRGEDGAYHPDPIIQSGQSLANTESPTGGGFNVTEVFGELNIPLLKNLIAAKDLSADISGRWSDYSTFGSVENWRAGLNWTPIQDIRFRANIGTSVRQPQIYEAFGGNTTGFPAGTDPCDSGQLGSGAYGSATGIVAANCARAIRGYDSTFAQAGSGQVPTISGGNPSLQPETARTYTIGTVLTPRWTPNLTATVDYFHTKIENSIGVLSTQYILDQCYTSANLSSPYCSQVNSRTSVGQLSTVIAPYQNLGEIRTNGIDFNLNYLIRLRHGFNVQLSNALTDTIGFTEQQTKDGPFQNFKGRIVTGLYGIAYPVLRDNATATVAKGPFSFAWTVRYIDGMQANDGSNDLTAETSKYYKVNEVFYHDIVATYAFKKILLVGGIQNLFDKTPLLSIDASTNTDPNVYDVIGRYFYAKLQVRF